MGASVSVRDTARVRMCECKLCVCTIERMCDNVHVFGFMCSHVCVYLCVSAHMWVCVCICMCAYAHAVVIRTKSKTAKKMKVS